MTCACMQQASNLGGRGLVFLLAHTIMAGPVIYGLEFQVPSTLDALYTLACNTITLCRTAVVNQYTCEQFAVMYSKF